MPEPVYSADVKPLGPQQVRDQRALAVEGVDAMSKEEEFERGMLAVRTLYGKQWDAELGYAKEWADEVQYDINGATESALDDSSLIFRKDGAEYWFLVGDGQWDADDPRGEMIEALLAERDKDGEALAVAKVALDAAEVKLREVMAERDRAMDALALAAQSFEYAVDENNKATTRFIRQVRTRTIRDEGARRGASALHHGAVRVVADDQRAHVDEHATRPRTRSDGEGTKRCVRVATEGCRELAADLEDRRRRSGQAPRSRRTARRRRQVAVGDKTDIEWTDATNNYLRGCSRTIAEGASTSGCGDPTGGGCYAERNGWRFAGPGMPYEGLVRMTPTGARWTGKVLVVNKHLLDALRWKDRSGSSRRRSRIPFTSGSRTRRSRSRSGCSRLRRVTSTSA